MFYNKIDERDLASRIRKTIMKRIWKIVILLLLGVYVVVSVMANIPEYTSRILVFEVWTDERIRTYELNETITIHLTLFNPTIAIVDLDFGSSHTHDYIILDKDNNELYRWSENFFFAAMEEKIRIIPLSWHTRTFKHSAGAYQLQPGKYTIRGVIVGYHGWNSYPSRDARFKDTTIRIIET